MISTTELCDAHSEMVQIATPLFINYGGKRSFAGFIQTAKVLEDNVIVRSMLEQPGNGRVLVVDGGASLRCALMGDMIANLAQQNGWAGIVLNAAVRDVDALSKIEIGIKALAAHPKKSGKQGLGQTNIPVTFAEVTFTPGDWLTSDADGIVIVPASKTLEVLEIAS
jgi:regulator of ribonuclease activity A